jgi:co-chaperonin GroES (HSP10)
MMTQTCLDLEADAPLNTSGLEPRGVAVLIEPYEPELKQGAIVIPDSVRASMTMVDNRAVVIAVGPNAWCDEPTPRARPGERVLVTKFAGFLAVGPKDGKQYRLVNDRDIFCALTD